MVIDENAPMTDESDFVGAILRREQAEEIRREVAFLAQSCRVIIAGHYFHGKSVKTLSEELNLPQGTIKSSGHPAGHPSQRSGVSLPRNIYGHGS